MTLKLTKGDRVELTKGRNLSKISFALGWDPAKYQGTLDFDLDAVAVLLTSSGKVASESDVVYYNNLTHTSGAVVHSGDNLTGAGISGTDKEVIKVDLAKIPAYADRISFVVSIFEWDKRKQNFGMVSNAFIRVIDDATSSELMRYDLSESFTQQTAVVVADIYRKDNEWKFQAIGTGVNGGLAEILRADGVNV